MIGRALRELRSDPVSTLSNPFDWLIHALGGERSRSGVSVSPDSAMRHADVYAAIRALADGVSTLPLYVYKGRGTEQKIVTGSLAANLLRNPAPGVTSMQLIGTTVAHLNAWGNAYWAKVRASGTAGVSQLVIIHPSRVAVTRDTSGEPVYTVTAGRGSTFAGVLNRRDLIHFKALSLDGLTGASPLRQCREAIGLGIATEEYAADFWSNSAHPAGILKSMDALTPEAAERLRATWESMHKGNGNAHRVAVLEAGLDWQSIGIPMGDSQFVEQRKLSTATIARIFAIPPWKIGAGSGDSMTYSNVEGQDLAFAKHSLRGWLTTLEQTISNDVDLFGSPDDYVAFYMNDLLRGDSAAQGAYYGRAIYRWLTPNEIRAELNKPPLPNGDELIVPAPEAPAPSNLKPGAIV